MIDFAPYAETLGPHPPTSVFRRQGHTCAFFPCIHTHRARAHTRPVPPPRQIAASAALRPVASEGRLRKP
jgi:hypothetical protein